LTQEADILLTDDWRRSSRSGMDGNCVEARLSGRAVQVRDSKDPDGPVLTFGGDEWRAFTGALKAGQLAGRP
jgi:hypothetical protein